MKRLLIILAVFALASPLMACLWDSDTLAAEGAGNVDEISIMMGGFPRNPKLYFEMRLERSQGLIEKDPKAWEAYDDAAVAADRIGDSTKAIEIMEAKIAAMKEAGFDGQGPQPNHAYRTKANLGTFYAHRWFKGGKDFSKLEDMIRARDLIAEAIKENPDAHFGREKYQLRVLNWVLSEDAVREPSFSDLGAPKDLYPDIFGLWKMKRAEIRENYDEMLRGITGLMHLGAAWQSVDAVYVIYALAAAKDHSSLRYLAKHRIEELQAAGGDYLRGWATTPADRERGAKLDDRWIRVRGYSEGRGSNTPKIFRRERSKVEDWHTRRTDYMMARLEKGQHPDADPEFWKGFPEHLGFNVDLRDEIPVANKSSVVGVATEFFEKPSVIVGAIVGALVVIGFALFMRREKHEG
ncbi:MAG: hypothetical protein KDB07_04965 [Planctomycetes bacterium]|nr:hypothetical protein [Planctomycetota bacterium]